MLAVIGIDVHDKQNTQQEQLIRVTTERDVRRYIITLFKIIEPDDATFRCL